MLEKLLGFRGGDWAPWVIGALCSAAVLAGGFLLRRHRLPCEPAASEAPVPAEAFVLDPFLYGSAAEKREALRRRGAPVGVLVSDVAAASPPYRGHVVDRSAGGLCLEVVEAAAVGAVLSVRVEHSGSPMPWVQVEVKNCRAVPGGWQLGCQFLRSPPSNILWSFG